eukprot:9080783-Pyramimonas_sp.AAC.1
MLARHSKPRRQRQRSFSRPSRARQARARARCRRCRQSPIVFRRAELALGGEGWQEVWGRDGDACQDLSLGIL